MTTTETTPSMIAAMAAMTEACETFAEWLRREDGSPVYPAGTNRDTPGNEAIWREWYDTNIAICQLAQQQVKAALILAKGGAAMTWTETAKQHPPDGHLIMTIDPGGHERILVRRGEMFLLDDESEYVFYTPSRWRLLTPGEIASVKAEQEAQVGRDCRDRLRRIEDRFSIKEAL